MRIRELVDACSQRGDLCTITEPVDSASMPGRIQDEEKDRNRAILFEHINGYNVPVLANLYGNMQRYAMGIGVEVSEMWERIDHAVAHPEPALTTSDAPCFEVVHDDPDITTLLPLAQYSERDAAPYITSGVVFMKDPDSGRVNISFIRHMVRGPKKLGFNPKSVHNQLYYNRIARKGRRMEVAITLGLPSEMLVAAAGYIPEGADEVQVATALAAPEHRGELAMTQCGAVDIQVPAGCEFVIEGVVSTDLETEGPFGDWTGCYARPQQKPTLDILRVSHRKDPVYQTILPVDSKEQILLTIVRFYPELEAIRRKYPEIKRYTIPEYALGRLVVVAVGPTERAHAIMDDYLGIQCINRAKVVNEDVNIDDPADVLWAVSNRILEQEKVVDRSCDDEWWNNLKLGIDTTVDIDDIRHVRPKIIHR